MSVGEPIAGGDTLTYTNTLFRPLLYIFFPMVIPAMLLNYMYYTAKVDPWISICVATVTGFGLAGASFLSYYKTADYLHGRKHWILTWRDDRDHDWTDYALIKSITKRAGTKMEELAKSNPTSMGKLQDPDLVPLIPYEVLFEDFAPMDGVLLLSPVDEDRLVKYKKQPVIFRGLIVNANATVISISKAREIEWEGRRIPVGVPKDCNYFAEQTQLKAGSFNPTKAQVLSAVNMYGLAIASELKQKLVTKEAENEGLRVSLKDFDDKVARVSAARIKHAKWVDDEKVPKITWFKYKKTWLYLALAGLALASIYLLWIGVFKLP